MGQPASPRAPSSTSVRWISSLSHTLSNIRSRSWLTRDPPSVYALARSLARLTEGGGITYEEGEREGGCFECSFRVKETVNRSIAGAAGEREKERKEGREGEREIMEEKECVNQPVSGGERSWGEERERGRKKRSVGEEGERERKREEG